MKFLKPFFLSLLLLAQPTYGTLVNPTTVADGAITRAKLATGAVAMVNAAAKSANYTVTTSDDYLEGDASSASFTFTLPAAASGNKGMEVIFVRTDQTFANDITITDSTLTKHLTTQNEMWKMVSNGSAWKAVSHYTGSSISFTPTLTAYGTSPTINYSAFYRQGRNFCGEMKITADASPANTEARISLPRATPAGLPTVSQCGEYLRTTSSSNHGGYLLKEASTAYMTITSAGIIGSASANPSTKDTGQNSVDPSLPMLYRFCVPLNNWED